MKKYIGALGCIILCEFAGAIGAFVTAPEIRSWYAELHKPFFNPPAWIFGPVWTVLYALMGISLYLVLRKGLNNPKIKVAVSVFAVQLVLNALWSIIFFGLHAVDVSLLEIICLWIAILVTTLLFARIAKPAAWLLVPYLAWVTFAGCLNYAILTLN